VTNTTLPNTHCYSGTLQHRRSQSWPNKLCQTGCYFLRRAATIRLRTPSRSNLCTILSSGQLGAGQLGAALSVRQALMRFFSTLFSSHNKSIGFLCTHYFSHTINLQYKSAKDLPNAHFFFRQMGDECSWRGKGHRDFRAHRATPSASCSTTTPYAHGLRLAHDVSRKFDAK
jgi:hypothetical protein